MQLLPFKVSDTEYSVFVILEAENVERMKANDPAQFNLWKMPEPWSKLQLRDVIIAQPTPQDIDIAVGLMHQHKPDEAMGYLSRGFKFDPKQGDSDLPYLKPHPKGH